MNVTLVTAPAPPPRLPTPARLRSFWRSLPLTYRCEERNAEIVRSGGPFVCATQENTRYPWHYPRIPLKKNPRRNTP